MTPRETPIPRPARRTDYALFFVTRGAEKGWQDLRATQVNALCDAWEFLTRSPETVTAVNHQLKGHELGSVRYQGITYARWQHELRGGARLWFFVRGREVLIEQVHTRHPNQTK